MSTIKPAAYPNSTAITCTLASLAATTADPPVGRESAEVLQSTDLANDVLLDGKFKSAAANAAAGQIQVWAWGAGYDGTTVRRPGGATGADAGLTPGSWWKDVFVPVAIINTTATNSKAYDFAGVSLLKCFGGLYLPARWGLFVFHNIETTTAVWSATAGDFELRYTPVQTQVV